MKPSATTSDRAAAPLTDLPSVDEIRAAQDRFIEFWGEMGTRWGVQRSVAEVHALLFIAGEPLSAEEIMERLSISRGSVSTTLKQLDEWELVQRVRSKDRADRREGRLEALLHHPPCPQAPRVRSADRGARRLPRRPEVLAQDRPPEAARSEDR
jgi:DNA-binding transcriptional ArsR family regulator